MRLKSGSRSRREKGAGVYVKEDRAFVNILRDQDAVRYVLSEILRLYAVLI